MIIQNARRVFPDQPHVDMDITFELGDVIPAAYMVGDTIPYTYLPGDNALLANAIAPLVAADTFAIAAYVAPPAPEPRDGDAGEQLA